MSIKEREKRIEMKNILIACLLLFTAASCTMPETNIYSLYIPVEKAPSARQSGLSVAISAKAPRYLAQSYIAFRNSPYQLEISGYSKWQAPPVEMVKEAFKEALGSTGLFREVRTAHSVSSDFYTLRINLRSLEGFNADNSALGQIIFDSEFYAPDGKELYHGTISKKIKLEDKTPLSLAKGLSTALAEGIEEVKGSIVKTLQ